MDCLTVAVAIALCGLLYLTSPLTLSPQSLLDPIFTEPGVVGVLGYEADKAYIATHGMEAYTQSPYMVRATEHGVCMTCCNSVFRTVCTWTRVRWALCAINTGSTQHSCIMVAPWMALPPQKADGVRLVWNYFGSVLGQGTGQQCDQAGVHPCGEGQACIGWLSNQAYPDGAGQCYTVSLAYVRPIRRDCLSTTR